MNEELLNELRKFRDVVKGDFSTEDIYQLNIRAQELAKVHTWPVLYEVAEFVAREVQGPPVDK